MKHYSKVIGSCIECPACDRLEYWDGPAKEHYCDEMGAELKKLDNYHDEGEEYIHPDCPLNEWEE